MSSISGLSSAPTQSYLPPQSFTAATPKDKDHDGDVDKAGAIDKDKGNNLNVTA